MNHLKSIFGRRNKSAELQDVLSSESTQSLAVISSSPTNSQDQRVDYKNKTLNQLNNLWKLYKSSNTVVKQHYYRKIIDLFVDTYYFHKFTYDALAENHSFNSMFLKFMTENLTFGFKSTLKSECSELENLNLSNLSKIPSVSQKCAEKIYEFLYVKEIKTLDLILIFVQESTELKIDCSLPQLLFDVVCIFWFSKPQDCDQLTQLYQGMKLEEILIKILFHICNIPSVIKILINFDKLSNFFLLPLIPTLNVSMHDQMLFIATFIAKYNLNDTVHEYIYNSGYLLVALNMVSNNIYTYNTSELHDSIMLLLTLLQFSTAFNMNLIEEFGKNFGYNLLTTALITLDEKNTHESRKYIKSLMSYISEFVYLGSHVLEIEQDPDDKYVPKKIANVNPSIDSSSKNFDSHIKSCYPANLFNDNASALLVRNSKAIQVLQNYFFRSSDNSNKELFLDSLAKVYSCNPFNFYALQNLRTLSQLVESLKHQNPSVANGIHSLLVFCVTQINVVPYHAICALWSVVSELIPESKRIDVLTDCFNTIIVFLKYDSNFCEILADSGFFDGLIHFLQRYHKAVALNLLVSYRKKLEAFNILTSHSNSEFIKTGQLSFPDDAVYRLLCKLNSKNFANFKFLIERVLSVLGASKNTSVVDEKESKNTSVVDEKESNAVVTTNVLVSADANQSLNTDNLEQQDKTGDDSSMSVKKLREFCDAFARHVPDLLALLSMDDSIEPLEYNDSYRSVTELLTLLISSSHLNSSKLLSKSKSVLMLNHLMQERLTRLGALNILIQLILNDSFQISGNMGNLLYILECTQDMSTHYDIMQALIFLFKKTPESKNSFRKAKGFTIVISSLKLLKLKFTETSKLHSSKEYKLNRDFLYLILATVSLAASGNRKNQMFMRIYSFCTRFNNLIAETGFWESDPELLIDWIIQLCCGNLVYVAPPDENVPSNSDDLNNAKAQFAEFESRETQRLVGYRQGLHDYIYDCISSSSDVTLSNGFQKIRSAISESFNPGKNKSHSDLKFFWRTYLPPTQCMLLLFHSDLILKVFELLPSSLENTKTSYTRFQLLADDYPDNVKQFYPHLYLVFRCVDLLCAHTANLEALSSANIASLCMEKWSSELLDFESILFTPMTYLIESLMSYRPSTLDINSFFKLLEPSKHGLDNLCHLSRLLLRIINAGKNNHAPFFYFFNNEIDKYPSMSCSVSPAIWPGNEGFTVSVWVCVENFGLDDNIHLLSVNLTNEYDLTLHLKAGYLTLNCPSIQQKTIKKPRFNTGLWYNITVVHERFIFANPETKVYINGKLEKTFKFSLNLSNLTKFKAVFNSKTSSQNRKLVRNSQDYAVWLLGSFLTLNVYLNLLEVNLLFLLGPNFYGNLLNSIKSNLDYMPLNSRFLSLCRTTKVFSKFENFDVSKIQLKKFKDKHIVVLVNCSNEVIHQSTLAFNLQHGPYSKAFIDQQPSSSLTLNDIGKAAESQEDEGENVADTRLYSSVDTTADARDFNEVDRESVEYSYVTDEMSEIEDFEYITNVSSSNLVNSEKAANLFISKVLTYNSEYLPMACWPKPFHKVCFRKSELDMLLYWAEYVLIVHYLEEDDKLQTEPTKMEKSKKVDDNVVVSANRNLCNAKVLEIFLNVIGCMTITTKYEHTAASVLEQNNGYSVLSSIFFKYPKLITKKTLNLLICMCNGIDPCGVDAGVFDSDAGNLDSPRLFPDDDQIGTINGSASAVSRNNYKTSVSHGTINTDLLINTLAFCHFFENHNTWINSPIEMQILIFNSISRFITNNLMSYYNILQMRKTYTYRSLINMLFSENIEISLLPCIMSLMNDMMFVKLFPEDLKALCDFAVFTFTIENPSEQKRYEGLRNMFSNILCTHVFNNTLINKSMFESILNPNWILLFLSYEKHPDTLSKIISVLVHLCQSFSSYFTKWQESGGFKYLSKILPTFHDYVPLYYILVSWHFGMSVTKLPNNLGQLDFMSLYQVFKLSDLSKHLNGCVKALDLIVGMMSASYLTLSKIEANQSPFLWISMLIDECSDTQDLSTKLTSPEKLFRGRHEAAADNLYIRDNLKLNLSDVNLFEINQQSDNIISVSSRSLQSSLGLDYQSYTNSVVTEDFSKDYLVISMQMKTSTWPYKVLFEFLIASLPYRRPLDFLACFKKFNKITSIISLIFPYSETKFETLDSFIWQLPEFLDANHGNDKDSNTNSYSIDHLKSIISSGRKKNKTCIDLETYYASKVEEETYIHSIIPPLSFVQIWNFYVLKLISQVFFCRYFIFDKNVSNDESLSKFLEFSPPFYLEKSNLKCYLYVLFEAILFQLKSQHLMVIKDSDASAVSLIKTLSPLNQLCNYMLEHGLSTLGQYPAFLKTLSNFMFFAIMIIRDRATELSRQVQNPKRMTLVYDNVVKCVRSLVRVMLWRMKKSLDVNSDTISNTIDEKMDVIRCWIDWRGELLSSHCLDRESFSVMASMLNQFLKVKNDELRILVAALWRHLLLAKLDFFESLLSVKFNKNETVSLLSGFNLLLGSMQQHGNNPDVIKHHSQLSLSPSDELHIGDSRQQTKAFLSWHSRNLTVIESVFNEGINKLAPLWWSSEAKLLGERVNMFKKNRTSRSESLQKKMLRANTGASTANISINSNESIVYNNSLSASNINSAIVSATGSVGTTNNNTSSSSIFGNMFLSKNVIDIDLLLKEVKSQELETLKKFRKYWLETEVYWSCKWKIRVTELFSELSVWGMKSQVSASSLMNSAIPPRHSLQKYKLAETEGPNRTRRRFEVNHAFYRKYQFDPKILQLASEYHLANVLKQPQSLSFLTFMMLPKIEKYMIDCSYYVENMTKHLVCVGGEKFSESYNTAKYLKKLKAGVLSSSSNNDSSSSVLNQSSSDSLFSVSSDSQTSLMPSGGSQIKSLNYISNLRESNIKKLYSFTLMRRDVESMNTEIPSVQNLNYFDAKCYDSFHDYMKSASSAVANDNQILCSHEHILYGKDDTGENKKHFVSSLVPSSSILESEASTKSLELADEPFVDQEQHAVTTSPTEDEVVSGNVVSELQQLETETVAHKDRDEFWTLLISNEKPYHIYNCSRVVGLGTVKGILLICKLRAYFVEGYTFSEGDVLKLTAQTEQNAESNETADSKTIQWPYAKLKFFLKRRFLLRPTAIEIFCLDGRNYLLVFEASECDKVMKDIYKYFRLAGGRLDAQIKASSTKGLHEETAQWVTGAMSNFEYLMHLNTHAGRSYNDVTQYPVYPWILKDYTSQELDLNDINVYRDLSRPMGALGESRVKYYRERFEMMDDSKPKFFYGSHYSQAAIVLQYLIRLEPFTSQFLELQGERWDEPDRIFNSIERSWNNCSQNDPADVRELIPEFFYLPQFLVNENNFIFGLSQTSHEEDGMLDEHVIEINNVILPPWARGSPSLFVRKNRQALESPYVSENLHNWIDLIFGYKQRGEPALKAMNVFFYLTYEGSQDLSILDPEERQAIIDQIRHFGQTPVQLFKQPHPKRQTIPKIASGLFGVTVINEDDSLANTGGSSSICSFISSSKHVRVSQSLVPTQIKVKNLDLNLASESHAPSNQQLFTSKQFALDYPGQPEKHIYWTHEDFCIRFYKNKKLKLAVSCNSHSGGFISCVELSENGEYLVTGGTDSLICVYNLDWSHEIPKLSPAHETLSSSKLFGHNFPIFSLKVSSKFSMIVSSDICGQVLLWDLVNMSYIECVYSSVWDPPEMINLKSLSSDQQADSLNLRTIFNDHWLNYLNNHGTLSYSSHCNLTRSNRSCSPHENCKVHIKIDQKNGNVIIAREGFVIIKDGSGALITQKVVSKNFQISALAVTEDSEWMNHVNFYFFGLSDGTIKVYKPSFEPQQASTSQKQQLCYGRSSSSCYRLVFHTTLQKVHFCSITELKINAAEKALYSVDDLDNVYKWQNPNVHVDN